MCELPVEAPKNMLKYQKNFALNPEVAKKIIKQKRPTFAEMKKLDDEWNAERAKVEKAYKTVYRSETMALDESVLRFLKYRLPHVKTGWEKAHNIDKDHCPEQYQEYCDLCELIELTDYILDEKWDTEIPDPEPYDWNGKSFNEFWKDNFTKNPDGSSTMKPSSPAKQKYYDDKRALEYKKRDRWLELLNTLFWRLGV